MRDFLRTASSEVAHGGQRGEAIGPSNRRRTLFLPVVQERFPLAGETGRFLRFPALPGAGGQFAVKVSNAFSEFTSESGLVTIRPDTDAPKLVSIRGLAGGVNRIELLFDEELDPVTATDSASYSSPLYRVRSAVLGLDGKSVTP